MVQFEESREVNLSLASVIEHETSLGKASSFTWQASSSLIHLTCLSWSCPIYHHGLSTHCPLHAVSSFVPILTALLLAWMPFTTSFAWLTIDIIALKQLEDPPLYAQHTCCILLPSSDITCALPAPQLNSQLLEGSSYGWLIFVPGLEYMLVKVLFN